MGWSKEQAQAYMSGKNYDEVESTQTSQPVDDKATSADVNVETSDAATDKAETSDTNVEETKPVSEEAISTSTDTTDSPEKTENDDKGKKSQKHSQEEKQRHAFAKEKNKRKEIQAKLDGTLKEIEELKAKLAKYEGLTRDDFKGDDDAYADYKIDRRFDKEKVERLQHDYDAEKTRISQEEAEEIANERLMNCYPDEGERSKYQQLVYNAENNFARMHPEYGYNKFSEFLMSEEDKTVLQYLQDSDNSPKLIRHFIMKPEAAEKIMRMRNPYNKIVELKQLENRMLQYERVKATQNKALSQPVAEKRQIPNTGKVVNNNTVNNGIDYSRPWTKKDAENYIASHK